MSWNYRVVRREGGWLSLHEVHYNEDGAPKWRTVDPAVFGSDEAEGLDGLVMSLTRALKDARDRPILDDVVFAETPDEI